MNKLQILVVFLFTLSCDSSVFTPCGQEHYLDSSEKICLELNDTLVYKSVQDSIIYSISLLDSGLISYTQTGQSLSGCLAYYEFEIIGICPLNDTSCRDTVEKMIYQNYKDCQECGNCMTICKKMSTDPISSRYKTMEDPILAYFNQWSDQLSNHTQYKSEFQINGHTYRNCYVFSISSCDLIELYYNHSFGFVGFKTTKGITYNLKI